MEFANKVVLVTGSSSGIGASTALEFAKLGARVVITGRDAQKLRAVEQNCLTLAPPGPELLKKRVLSIAADVAIDSDLRRLIDSMISEFGRLDVLVNNAGVMGFSSIFSQDAIGDLDRTMAINLRSVYVLTHYAMPHLVKSRGNIINVSSISGSKPSPEFAPYAMSKAALEMFTHCLALEVGPQGVRVNCVKPGLVKTPIFEASGMTAEQAKELLESQAEHVPLRRVGTPEEIAGLITFLASDKAANMTGSLIVSDGGRMWAPRPKMKPSN